MGHLLSRRVPSLFFCRVLQQGVCVTSVRHKVLDLPLHTVSTQDGCHMVPTTSMCSHLAKISQIIDENGHFHETSPLTRTSKNQHGHKNASFLEKKVHSDCRGLILLASGSLILLARGVKQD